jgi:hypothetical protein
MIPYKKQNLTRSLPQGHEPLALAIPPLWWMSKSNRVGLWDRIVKEQNEMIFIFCCTTFELKGSP